MPTRSRPSPTAGERIDLDLAEAALVERYARLVRLTYLVLPTSLTRHRRVLTAHGIVQRALPGTGTRLLRPAPRRVPAPRGARERPGYAWVREQVLREALRHARSPSWWPHRLPPPRALRPGLPTVIGLRLFPHAGGTEEVALDQALGQTDGATRAAFVLATLDELPPEGVDDVLVRLGVDDPAGARERAAGLAGAARGAAEALVRSDEFDPSSLRTQPTDLLRRRHRVRLGLITGTALVVTGGVLGVVGSGATPLTGPPPVPHGSGALDPDRVVVRSRTSWDDTARVDFTAWPARGSRTKDTDLLAKALNAWARAGGALGEDGRASRAAGTAFTRAPGTPAGAPTGSPRLLYAGDVEGDAVVLLHDGDRVARYTEPASGGGAAFEVGRTDDADVTTAAALVLHRSKAGARWLTAPWVDESATRDLLRPDTPARALGVSKDGVTSPLPEPPAGGGCGTWPVVQFRSSARIVEKHSFLLTDLGALSPAHLTYTPPPGAGAPARQPREATGSRALVTWARLACRLGALRGEGVRAVNTWDYAAQRLPEGGGEAVWACTRADTWAGRGDVFLSLRTPAARPAAPVEVVARADGTAACSRFGQHVVAGARWKSPQGHWYALGAGSRQVTALTTSGAVSGTHPGTTFAVRAPEDGAVRVRARLGNGETLDEVGR
ncbi:hypothetical protein ACIP5N_15655 [Streptomyces sp. NPDC088768]|uniref:hypothetical protein n=1 Tax=Streptomyces sp. NPDC088768 TaxID=3365894 RepID=UPI00381BF27C